MKTAKSILLFLFITLVSIFTSCKTAPLLKGIIEPFGIIGTNADIYIYMPVEQNRSIVEQALPLAAGKDMKRALGRTTAVYSGVFFNRSGSEVRVCARGKYPYGMTDSFFKKKNGWDPKKTKDGYKFYESPYLDVSIPSPLIACIGMGAENRANMEELLSRMKTPVEPQFSERFNSLIKSDLQDIGIFVKNSDVFLSGILGVSLGLPLGKIEMYLKKDLTSTSKNMYLYNLYIESENPRTAKIAKMLLQRMFNTEVKLEEDMLIIENGAIPESKIISIIKSVYPY